MSSNSADKSDKKLPSKEKLDLIYKMFEGYFKGEPLIDVWEVHSEIIFGPKNEIGYKLLTEANPSVILMGAKNDPKAFELFHQAMVHALNNHLEIPKPAQLLLAEYLTNPSIRPKQKAGPKADHEFNWRLRFALLHLEDEGITPTRSPATDPDTYKSGIDIVLEILCFFDQSNEYTYETLERRFYRTLKDHPRPPSDISS